ncbi:glutamate racemase [Halanaerobium sp. DL-01]|uniref:glutamate racemase n=1 Tax=Halanaerobium sp. DL-01 TaxID=1653064 RepID=UPI000DF3929E|nr:glutamate racemase [Halanaerobium sp. DL-01]RCW88015.1 glutamate racemase [Halanaerobium sp. DL-01]
MYEKNRPIGLLDSGVGGLTAAKEILDILENEKIIYYGDTLHLPYGPKNLDDVRKYVKKIVRYLIEEWKVKVVVLACNTATSAALEILKKEFFIPIFGIIDSGARKAVEISKKKRIGLIGTQGTISSMAYQNAVRSYDIMQKIYAEPCPLFVEMVEKGEFTGREIEKTAEKYLQNLIKNDIDVLILGCTHYPYLAPVLKKIVGNKIKLIDPSLEIAGDLKKFLIKNDLLNISPHAAEHQFIVSDIDKIYQKFLVEGRKFLKLDNLHFVEDNIFTEY